MPAIDATTLSSATAARVFPAEGTTLARVLHDAEFRKAFHTRLKSSNRFMVALYRIGLLPLFGLGRSIMLLGTQGRVSGTRRDFPVGYIRIGKDLMLLSAWGKNANWYKNILAHPDKVTVQIGLRRIPVRAQVVDDPAEVRSLMLRFVRESPVGAKQVLGWDAAHDCPESADFSPIAQQVLVVRFVAK